MAVNTTGAAASASAMLDVSSTTQGMLVPRMTTTQRNSISSPATGLLVWDNSIGAFYFYNGSAWTSLSAPTGTAGGDLTGSYPSPSIASGAVTSGKIASGTITSGNIASGTITGSNIATNTITTVNLPAGATATTYLRGDNTWATPSGGGSGYTYISSATTLANASGNYMVTAACTVTLPSSPSTNTEIYIIATAYNIKVNTNGSFFDPTGWLGTYQHTYASGTYRIGESAASAGDQLFLYSARFIYNGSIWVYVPY